MAKAFQFRARLHESVRSRRLFAPEGLLRVAQRFNAGNDGHNKPAQAPPGATETLPNRSFIPPGLAVVCGRTVPAMNRWAQTS